MTTPPRSIDLNADVGEDPAALADGREAALVGLVTSVNVACGGHAGTPESMAALVELARRCGAGLGAHPGYPDRDGFGRRDLALAPPELERTVAQQVEALLEIAAARGVAVRHVKPHGALYNTAARDRGVAASIAAGVRACGGDLVLVGLAGSVMLEVWREAGFRVAAEAFADRRYEPDGTLRPRRYADALITAPEAAARHAVELVAGRQKPETLCIHGDTPNACDIAREVRAALQAHGLRIAALGA
jgi:UPF0271 protein